MQVKMKRTVAVQTVAVGTATTSSSSLRFDNMAGAVVAVNGNTASCTFTVWGSGDNATFRVLAGTDGVAATLTIPADGGMVDLPAAAFAAPYLRFVTSDALSTAASVAVGCKT